MGFVVDAVSSVVGGVADAVGTVAEAAVDVASNVVEAVADNPLLLAAAVAAPIALGGLATSAVATEGVIGAADAATSGLIGSGVMGAAGATPELLASYAASQGAGAGILGAAGAGGLSLGSGVATGLGAAGLGAGAAELGAAGLGAASSIPTAADIGAGFGTDIAGGAVDNTFTFLPSNQAASISEAVNTATNSPVAVFSPQNTLASTIAESNPSFVFDSNYLSSNTFTQMQNAASLANSPGMSFSDVLAQTTGGAVAPTNSTGFFANAWDSAKGIMNQVNNFTNQIGQTIAPNAPPIVQKGITNFGVNMVTTGGDVKASLENAGIGAGASMLGSQVTNALAPEIGKTGANIAGSAAANLAGGVASGAPIESVLAGTGAGVVGQGVTSVTGSPLLGSFAKSATGATLSGGDIGTGLLAGGLGAGASYLNNLAGITPTSAVGKIVAPIESGAISSLLSQGTNVSPLKTASNLSSIVKPVIKPTVKTAPLSAAKLPPRQVDVSSLKPVDLSTLGFKI